MNKDIYVSVWIITYNHKDYIEQCLKSVLSQVTNFNYEIIVHDDASNDGTTDIVRQYANKYSNIVPVIQKENRFSKGEGQTFYRDYLLPVTRGYYIAWCEGDDYWSDSYKLQKQVDGLQASNAEYCFHKVDVVDAFSGKIIDVFPTCKFQPSSTGLISKHKFSKIAFHNQIHFSSVMITKSLFEDYANDIPDYALISPVGDYSFSVFFYYHSSAYYIADSMSVYRRGVPKGWTAENTNSNRQIDELYQKIEIMLLTAKDHATIQEGKLIDRVINRYKFGCALNNGQNILALKCLFKAGLREVGLRNVVRLFIGSVSHLFETGKE